MSNKQQRFNAPDKVGARSFAQSDAQYQNPNGGSWAASLALAPLDRREYHYSIIALSYIAELLGTFVFVFVVNLAKASITGVMTSVETFLAGTFLGAIGGLTYYLATGWNMDSPDAEYAELPKHLSWTVTIAYSILFRTGWLLSLFYLLAQTCGALLAAGLLYFLGKGTLPTPLAADMGKTWFVEIIGVFFIVFPLLFKHMMGATLTEEDARIRNAQYYAAGGRAFATAVFFQFQGYSFEPMVYLAGMVALCTDAGCPNTTPFGGAPAFYLLVPLLGSLVAVLFYAIALLFVNCTMWGKPRKTRRVSAKAPVDAEARIASNASATQAGRTEPLLRKTAASDLDKYN